MGTRAQGPHPRVTSEGADRREGEGRRHSDGAMPFCVCVPARNEAERLPILLAALSKHGLAEPANVLVAVNNSDDGSRGVLMEAARRHSETLVLRIDERVFPSDVAHAGSARRRAMDLGLAWLGGRGVLLTTDADTRPPPQWIASNLKAIACGADMVGGALVLDDEEPIDDKAAGLKARWDAYWASVRQVEDDLDPRLEDPSPRHGDHTGASLAIRAALYQRIGGVPLLASGEDRALVRAGVKAGGRLAHPAGVWTRVSPRRDGRAAGGMAEDMASLLAAARTGSVPMAPDLLHWRERAIWRRRTRDAVGVGRMIELEDDLPPMPMDMPLAAARP